MVKPQSKYSAGAYEHRFGSWRKALEKFIEFVNKETKAETTSKPITKTKLKTKRGISLRMRFIVMRRDDFKCKICGKSPSTDPSVTLQVDHIEPWSKGGETVPDNLQTLCSHCNTGKSNLDL